MRTLIYQTVPDVEGIDNTQEVEIPDDFSWELRFYCDLCDTEVVEDEIQSHKCEEKDDSN